MTQKAIKVGSSVAVVIPKESLKELGIKAGDELNVEVDRRTKSVTVKAKAGLSPADQRIAELTMKFVKRYRSDLEKLRDR